MDYLPLSKLTYSVNLMNPTIVAILKKLVMKKVIETIVEKTGDTERVRVVEHNEISKPKVAAATTLVGALSLLLLETSELLAALNTVLDLIK